MVTLLYASTAIGEILLYSEFKMDYQNVTESGTLTGRNEYLNMPNAKDTYEELLQHGPLDIKVYWGNLDPSF